MARLRGRVKWYNDEKGYGFITPDDTAKKDHFVHHSAVKERTPGRPRLEDGQSVEFDSEADTKGPKATNVVGV